MKDKISIRFNSDKVSLNGPRIDGSYRVTFDVGEYQLEQISPLVIVGQENMTVLVEVSKDNG